MLMQHGKHWSNKKNDASLHRKSVKASDTLPFITWPSERVAQPELGKLLRKRAIVNLFAMREQNMVPSSLQAQRNLLRFGLRPPAT